MKIFGLAMITLFCIAICLYITFLHRKLTDKEQYESLYKASESKVKIFQAKDSTWHTVTNTVTVTDPKVVAQLAGISESFSGLKKSLKNLENYTAINAITTIHKTVYIKDSAFSSVTKYDSISGFIHDDSITIVDKHKVDLEVVEYWDKSWLLGKKKYKTEIKSLDPNTKVVYSQSIRKERRRGLF